MRSRLASIKVSRRYDGTSQLVVVVVVVPSERRAFPITALEE